MDAAGNVYLADHNGDAVREYVHAYVSGVPVTENAAASSDALAVVLPSSQALTGLYVPTSDQSWLTIGTCANGVVNFSFTADTGAARTAHISLLGQQVTVTQGGTPTLGTPTISAITATSATLNSRGHIGRRRTAHRGRRRSL